MINKFPNKLRDLRKSLGYAQGEMASRLDVSVKDYMNWENGNSLPAFAQIQKMAILFNIPVELLMDNKKEISEDLLNTLSKSVTIPSFVKATPEVILTDTMPLETGENLGETKVMSAIQDSPRKEAIKKEVEKRKKISRKVIWIGSAVSAVVLVVLVLVFVFLFNRKSNLTISDVNRLALGKHFSIYIADNGSVQIRGNLNNRSVFENIVQVSNYDDHVVGLKKDGTVVSSESHDDVSRMRSIQMVAAGYDHILALKKDGSVVCSGNENACSVSEWKNVKRIYAGKNVSFGLRSDGQVLVAGDGAEVKGIRGVQSICANDQMIALVRKDGAVQVIAKTKKEIPNTSHLSDVKYVALHKEGVFAIGQNNKIQWSVLDEEKASFDKATLSRWQNMRFIAGNGDTLVGIDQNGKMAGIGNNDSNQYENTSVLAEPQVNKLGQVKNIKFKETTANVNITWDPVENADRYRVTIDTEPMFDKQDIASNSTSIPATKLESGKTYRVTVTALSDKTDKYSESDVTTINYTYNQKVINLEAPKNVTNEVTNEGWVFKWDKVEHADYYKIVYDGRILVDKQKDPIYHIDNEGIPENSKHKIEITAHSNQPEVYRDSPPVIIEATYTVKKFDITFVFVRNGAEVGRKSYRLAQGSYLLGSIIQDADIPGGYHLSNPSSEVSISKSGELNVEVK
ncbi:MULTISPECIES: fibronectin type III domain-containing protein [Terrabacteria group]|uniref:fibronectin type III domain-containing protein n=1 Tax=Bacillati TaxID=1783272 RepID=UPI001C6DE4D7|nr:MULTISPECIES: helix-turn-helix domain-containing protein [Terrabacteria group]MBW9212453.1 helix-turn-helix domain-containing protein [Trueperella sp. zg.1013]